MVWAAGRNRQPPVSPPPATAQRSRHSLVGTQRHIHVYRLDRLTRPALVQHDFRPAHYGRPGPERAGLPDHGYRASLEPASAGGCDYAAASARPRETHAGHGDGLGVFLLLPISDYLGRQPGGGDPMVHRAPERGVAVRRPDARLPALCTSVRVVAFARDQTEPGTAHGSCGCNPGDAPGGSLLAGHAG